MTLACSLADLHAFLRAKNGLIVHFSSAPSGISSGWQQPYPNDLHHVLAGDAQTGLACSLVTPGDNFAGNCRNAMGCIGVVVDLVDQESLLAVSSGDAGSEIRDGVRYYHPMNVTLADCDDSLTARTLHNEWGVKNYRPLGIFAIGPFEIWDHQAGRVGRTTYPKVIQDFSGWPVFTFMNGQVYSGGSPYLLR